MQEMIAGQIGALPVVVVKFMNVIQVFVFEW
jgi:hypothetical protein